MGEAHEIETGTPQLRGRLEAHVAVLTLARPEARNALTWEMKDALAATLARLAHDPDVRCVLLSGAGGAFCAGGDTKVMAQGPPTDRELRIAVLRREHEIPLALATMGKPTLAVLPGPAAGAGI